MDPLGLGDKGPQSAGFAMRRCRLLDVPLFRRTRRTRPSDAECEEIIDRDVALAGSLGREHRQHLRELTLELIESKRWEAIPPLEMTNEVRITIAANAAIPILNLDPWIYRNVRSIIVAAATMTSRGRRSGPARGVYSDRPMAVSGTAGPNSMPISISWRSALSDSRKPERGRNLVIHEFAHKIDMADGYSDGQPPMRGEDAARWAQLLDDQFDSEPMEDEPLRPYAWTNKAEFFAVATEEFFCRPEPLALGRPDLYVALTDFYRQNPVERLGPHLPPPDVSP